MKVGVITFWYTEDNYGQLLQLYAMQTILKNMGHEPFVIRYTNLSPTRKKNRYSLLSFLKNIARFLYHPKSFIESKKRESIEKKWQKSLITHPRYFDRFRETHLTLSPIIYHSLAELRATPPPADVYICGSDVIWKESVNSMAYFIDFGSDTVKRIAYAPSFGSSFISANYRNAIKDKLKKFSLISVREESGVEICKYAGYEKAYWVLDPSFLIDAEIYKKLTQPNDKGVYSYLYLLGSPIGMSVKKILSFMKKHTTEVYYTSSQKRIDKFKKEYATFEEWLRFILNAEFVVTNSFHGCALSIIFHKKFLYMPIIGESSDLNDRVISLCHRLGLADRIFTESFDALYNDICWESVDAILERDRNYATNLLTEALNS